MQFVAVNVLQASFDPIRALVLTLMVNTRRHIFDGITMFRPLFVVLKENANKSTLTI
ncbi:hypothetical protein SAMN02745249_00576 [Atopostipes suicloacalis DSM 15692]|uniref:Uncharacterized protein n=1 Tax=Atopostipes suicloacalis DSM 15692 TaxID=1121025 RepID=A0A1M4U3X6_9LACT|nr:hypothetical protein [Atopostipes suicloacalis]SHE51343.1 hypothetical protein SAMN02745249_00576 [Atopostipes suicloacalis DSM 15692]